MSRVHDQVEALQQVEIFQGLSEGQLTAIAATSTPHDFAKGDVVVTEGDSDARVFVILEGEARVDCNGRAADQLGPGDYFGEMSLLDGEPRSATIVATTPIRALSIARFNFRPLLTNHPDIAEHILVEMSRRLRLARSEIRD
jgi:CRP/FNR family cyclic AMP-dependent transcriptional regulator